MSQLCRVGLSKESERIYKERREKEKVREGSPKLFERLYNWKPIDRRSMSTALPQQKKFDAAKQQEIVDRLVSYTKIQEENMERLQLHYKSMM
mmetsp:Transcript_7266/g.6401  ORF Transcript_7266/g.6401 Transcript_7266/m.6401 type:complete len:93 (+) Transcript_7266:523-801(+)